MQLVNMAVLYRICEVGGNIGDRKIGTATIGRSLGIGMIGSDISCINTNSTQISIARTTVTACHRSQRCWFQFRKTTKCFERDKVYINVNYRRQTSINPALKERKALWILFGVHTRWTVPSMSVSNQLLQSPQVFQAHYIPRVVLPEVPAIRSLENESIVHYGAVYRVAFVMGI